MSYLEAVGAVLTEAIALAWSAIEGFPTWAGVVLWPVAQIVGSVLLGLVLALAGLGWITESAQKRTAELKVRAEQDSKEALECSKYYR